MKSYNVTNVHNMRQTACFVCKELYWNVCLRLFLGSIAFGLGFLDLCIKNSGSFDVESLINQSDLASWSVLYIRDGGILYNSINVVQFC